VRSKKEGATSVAETLQRTEQVVTVTELREMLEDEDASLMSAGGP